MTETIRKPGLLLVGVNHTTAPLSVRERLAVPATRLADATRTLAHQPGVREALILSTCNRVEFLLHEAEAAGSSAVAAPAAEAGPMLPQFLADYFAVSASAIAPHLYQFREREAVRHLFRVASSLDSMVVGEPQILGQVKQSWNVARQVGAVQSTAASRSMLDPLLQRAFAVAKRVRTETRIGASSVSIASVAAELARKIFGSLEGKTILLVGAGKMSDLAARHLIAQGASALLVANRTRERAEAMAAHLRSADLRSAGRPGLLTGVVPFEQLAAEAHRADVVITSTGSADPVVTSEMARAMLQRRRNRPVFFVDMAVPRDVAASVNDIEGCFVYDMDDLQQVAATHAAGRSREAEAAERIVSREVERYDLDRARRPVTESIRRLTTDAEALRQAELARTAARLAADPLSPQQQAAVDALTRSLTAKLLHPQVAALRAPESDEAGPEPDAFDRQT